jgi:inosine-uridine nucleoside N-ribohydrolase
MAEKVLIVADPGIDAAFAVALALNDPNLEVLALAATAGNVKADLATRNAHIIIEQIDPARWPRLGAALPIEYDRYATDLHGTDGLGGQEFPCAELHHPTTSDRLIVDTLRQHPNEVSILLMGPATVLARAFDRDPDVVHLVRRLIMVGGSWHEAGDVSPCSEFHFWCDPISARQVLRSGVPVTLIPLDVTRKLIFSPNDIRHLGALETRTATFLRQVVPMLLAPTASHYGIEGAYVADALAVAFMSRPTAFTLKAVAADIEIRGELTRGMTVFDTRWSSTARPNLDLVTGIDVSVVRHYIHQILADSHDA